MMQTNHEIRQAAVKGMFYPESVGEVRMIIEKALEKESSGIESLQIRGTIAGGVVPHAGMVYCARQAVHFFEQCKRMGNRPMTVVLIHPNHGGVGPAASLDGYQSWEASQGHVPVDVDMAEALDLPFSPEAQAGEHSAEVMLPYLQYFFDHPFRILSVNMRDQEVHQARDIAEKIHEAEKALNKEILVIASSDFSHFLTPERSRELDDKVLQAILARDAVAVEETVRQHQVSVCGFGPIMALMAYAELKDPGYVVHMLRRGHSGEHRPSPEVVNYVSLLFAMDT